MTGDQALSGIEPLIGRLLVRAGMRPEVLTTRPHTDLYLQSYFILICFGYTLNTKEIQLFSLSRRIRLFWENFLHHQLRNTMLHIHANSLRSPRLHKQNKMIGKRRILHSTEHPLCGPRFVSTLILSLPVFGAKEAHILGQTLVWYLFP